jgi:hypothetical protein
MKKFLLVFLALSTSACFRTQYSNFDPVNNPSKGGDPTSYAVMKTGMQPFFVFGLVPGERVVSAKDLCGGVDKVAAIKTRKTFGMVLINLFLNELIFTPRSGAVYCSDPSIVKPAVSNVPPVTLKSTPAVESKDSDLESQAERIKTLKKAKEEGVITEKEYQQKRKAVVDAL